jgi:hypothetical protein
MGRTPAVTPLMYQSAAARLLNRCIRPDRTGSAGGVVDCAVEWLDGAGNVVSAVVDGGALLRSGPSRLVMAADPEVAGAAGTLGAGVVHVHLPGAPALGRRPELAGTPGLRHRDASGPVDCAAAVAELRPCPSSRRSHPPRPQPGRPACTTGRPSDSSARRHRMSLSNAPIAHDFHGDRPFTVPLRVPARRRPLIVEAT